MIHAPVDPSLETLWGNLLQALDQAPAAAVPSGEPVPAYRPEGGALPFVCLGGGAWPSARSMGGAALAGDHLFFAAAMEKDKPFNAARSGRERTWLTGDVFEVFFQPPGRAEYHEIHATPEGVLLRLRFPDVHLFSRLPFESVHDDETPARAHSRILSEAKRWLVAVSLPLSALGLSADRLPGARFALCRYDYAAPGAKPEISAIRVFPTTFHDPERWLPFA